MEVNFDQRGLREEVVVNDEYRAEILGTGIDGAVQRVETAYHSYLALREEVKNDVRESVAGT